MPDLTARLEGFPGALPKQATAHFTELDGMRGILACTVVLFHLGLNRVLSLATFGMIQAGEWGLCVDFFFILSRFVLYHSFCRKPPTFSSYFTKRIRRLAPMYYFSTVFMLLLLPEFHPHEIAINMLIVQSFLGMRSINFPAWSIPFELFLPVLGVYLVVPFQRASGIVVWFLLAAGIATGSIATVFFVTGHDVYLLRACFGIGDGMLLYRARSLTNDRVRDMNRPLIVYSLFAVTIVIMALALKWPALAVLFHPVAALCVFVGAGTKAAFSTSPLQALGRWSYSIYLLHIPILCAVERLAGQGTVKGNIILKGGVIVLTVAAAAFTYRFVELPFFSPRAKVKSQV